MPFKKYVEIEWREVRLKPFKDWGETKIYLNVGADYPTVYVPQNISEKMVCNVEQKQLEDKSWVIKPKNYVDRILFSGYVENMLQVAVTAMENDKNSPINHITDSTTKLADIIKGATGGITGKLFPFLGLATLLFSGIATLFKDADDFLGSCIYQLRRDSIIPLGRPLVCQLQKGDVVTGEVDIGIYIKPEDADCSLAYHDVEIFPFSAGEVAVYYSGELAGCRQVYMIWTLDNWSSNPLIKMKKWDKYWMALIELPKNHVPDSLELAFTNDDQRWDNHDGNNWVFKHFRWV
jgi:hypothetical protein